MKISNLLCTAICCTVVLSACSSDEEKLVLGSRDDIVIMKNGVPVSGSSSAMAETEVASEEMQPMVPEMEETVEEAVQEIAEIQAETMQAEATTAMKAGVSVEAAAVDAVQDEIKKVKTTVVSEAQNVEAQTQAKAAKAMMTPKGLNVEEAASDVVEKTTAVVSEAQPAGMAPVKEITMNKVEEEIEKSPVVEMTSKEPVSTDVVVEKVTETSAESMAKPKAEMMDGCFKTVLIPSAPGNVSPVPILEKRQIVCQKDITPSMVAILQKALMNRGYNLGSPDGRLGNKTFNALEDYQRKNGLGVGGITFETLEHLKIK